MTEHIKNTLTLSFENILDHSGYLSLNFEISNNEIFYLPENEKKKVSPLKFENDILFKKILQYSNYGLKNKKTTSFDVINWQKSSSISARYDSYEFSVLQEKTHLKLTKLKETHPRNLALKQDAAILEYIDDVILVTEAEPINGIGPRIIYMNQAFEKMSGYTLAEVFGKTPRIFQGENTADADREKIRNALTRWEPITIDIVNYTKNKKEFNVELIINPRKDETGWYTHWVSVQRDVTARKKIESQLEHQSKLALIGEIAAGVGHEINNPLAIIKGLLEMTQSSLKDLGINDEKIKMNFEYMNQASERIANITKGLRAFSRVNINKSDYFCAYDMLKETVDMLHDVYKKEGVDLKFSSNHKKLSLFGNRGRLQQAITNLITNAKDASDGEVTRLIHVKAYVASNNVLITIEDNGRGIPDFIKDKMFQPFFTTKDVNKGTGIGLSMTRAIVEEHNGNISFKSEIGRGTEFTISIPIVSEKNLVTEEVKVEEVKIVENDSKLKLLVVDDEIHLHEIYYFYFSKMGFDVELVENGKSALELIKSKHFDLIISDVSMPVMDGVALFKELEESNMLQTSKFMFITGEAGYECERLKDIIHKVDYVLEKPFKPDVFITKMHQIFPDRFKKT